MRRAGAAAVALAVLVVALASAIDAGGPGLISEEIQPYLTRYPLVLERRGDGEVAAMPPYEPDAPPSPRWVSTSEWPVVGYDGRARLWPAFVRGHQSALGSYVGLALAPLLGNGVAGVRRSSALMAIALVLGTFFLGRRLGMRGAGLGALLFASSAGLLWIARTGYGFELASRVGLVAALVLAAPKRQISTGRALAIGAAAGAAVLCRATVAIPLAPALAVLFASPARQIRARASVALTAAAIAVPLAAHAAIAYVSPFRDGSGPLAGFAVGELPARTAAAAHQLVLQLSWLGDASSVLRPMYTGAASASLGAIALAAIPAALVVAIAAARWRRGSAGEAERMLVCAALVCAVGAAWLYPGPDDFALAFGLEPIFALAVAAQVASIDRARTRALAIFFVLALRVHGAWAGRALESRVSNPMLSARTQRTAASALLALGATSGDVVTVRYHQVGVLEAWTRFALRPAHAWPVFAGGIDPTFAWRALLDERVPRWVLFTDGENICEADQPDGATLRRGLVAAARERGLALSPAGEFPTESGAPGWSLWQLSPAAPKAAAPPPPPPADPDQR